MIKRIVSIITGIMLTCMLTGAIAGGLFPTTNEMFGMAMPSVGIVINRVADGQCDMDSGSQETYLNFTIDDYRAFGQYLAGRIMSQLRHIFLEPGQKQKRRWLNLRIVYYRR